MPATSRPAAWPRLETVEPFEQRRDAGQRDDQLWHIACAMEGLDGFGEQPERHSGLAVRRVQPSRVAVVLFGVNLTLAALMAYLMLRHAGRTPGLAADDVAEEELQAFAGERRSAMLLQASATTVGVFLPLIAVTVYLALSVFFVMDPLRHVRVRARRPARIRVSAGG